MKKVFIWAIMSVISYAGFAQDVGSSSTKINGNFIRAFNEIIVPDSWSPVDPVISSVFQDNNHTGLNFSSIHGMGFVTNGNLRMQLNNGGNLHFQGGGVFAGAFVLNKPNASFRILSENSYMSIRSSNQPNANVIRCQDASGIGINMSSNADQTVGGIYFSTNGTNRFFIARNGNAWLRGRLEVQHLKVTNTPTADFVFEEGYNLPSLESVERHIQAKKHLPEIASAAEMEKEGVNVNEFQIQLLQKIEELTLYTIEQSKQIKDLQKSLIDLQKQVENKQ